METFLDTILKALKATANNEQQKTIAAFSISLNNMDVITKLQKLYQYCLNIGELKYAEEIKQEIIKRKVEITKELAENAFRKNDNMEINNPQHKSFLWHLDIEPFTWKTCYGEQCPSFVTEENKEVWRRYLEKLIKKHLKAEVMNTPEFREIETMVSYEKLVRIKMMSSASG